MTRKSNPCFCCSDTPFSECCEPVLANHANALTPLALMRSRYTAYVLKNNRHLLTTWDFSTRPKEFNTDDGAVKWLNLTIHSHGEAADKEDCGEVEFSARFLDHEQLCTMHETSRFRRKNGLWYYIDGKNETNCTKLGRNALCPCGSGKKFKRCCLIS